MKKRFIITVLAIALVLIPMLSFAIDLQLTWNPNTEADLQGYRIYRGIAAGGPYTQIGEIPQAGMPTYTWSVPARTEGIQYFVVTAYDQAGNESGYSNEVSIFVDNVAPGMPAGLTVIIIIIPPAVPLTP